jgi:hypothetical protein
MTAINNLKKMKNLTIISLILLTFLSNSCTIDSKDEPSLSSQKCMNENGPAFFLNSSDQCEWSQALSVCNNGDHWRGGKWGTEQGGFYSIALEIFRDGSNTSGTGKTKCESTYNCSGSWVGTFTWEKDPYNSKIILVTSSDAVFDQYSPFSSIAAIDPNASSPTTFEAEVTTPVYTYSMFFTKVSGSF